MDIKNDSLFGKAVAALKHTFSPGVNLQDGWGYARAHNFLFDTRAKGERERQYHQHLKLKQGSAEELFERHNDYYAKQVRDVLMIPSTFMEGNRGAFVVPLDGEMEFVRVENINSLLRKILGDPAGDLATAFQLLEWYLQIYNKGTAGQQDHNSAVRFLEDWLDIWNQERDMRPMYAACATDVAAIMDKPDWANEMRSSLGLAHLAPHGGKTYIAVMKYPIKDVVTSFERMAGAKSAFAVPSVLDNKIDEYFFPAPVYPPQEGCKSCGRIMPLHDTGQLTAELLHVKLAYKPGYIERLGVLQAPLHDHSIRELRNFHLLALQEDTGLSEFGDYIPEWQDPS